MDHVRGHSLHRGTEGPDAEGDHEDGDEHGDDDDGPDATGGAGQKAGASPLTFLHNPAEVVGRLVVFMHLDTTEARPE